MCSGLVCVALVRGPGAPLFLHQQIFFFQTEDLERPRSGAVCASSPCICQVGVSGVDLALSAICGPFARFEISKHYLNMCVQNVPVQYWPVLQQSRPGKLVFLGG